MAARRLVTSIAALALIVGAGVAFAHAARDPEPLALSRPPATPAYLEGEMLVKFKEGVSREQIRAFNARHGCSVADEIQGLGIFRLLLPEGVAVPDMIARYEASGLVEFAEPNRKVSIQPLPGARPVSKPLPKPVPSPAPEQEPRP